MAFVWLPDEKASVMLEPETLQGPVRSLHPSSFLREAASAMEDGETLTGIRASRQAALSDPQALGSWRGLIALCLLHDVLLPDTEVLLDEITPASGELCQSVLSVLGETRVGILSLKSGEKEIALGMTDPELLLVGARTLPPMSVLQGIPWYDGEQFSDPVRVLPPYLRSLLISRLRLAGGGNPVQAFAAQLERYRDAMVNRQLGEGEKLWEAGLKCILGLQSQAGFEALTVRRTPGAVSGGNRLLFALGIAEEARPVRGDASWYWKEQEIARESPDIFMEVLMDEAAQAAVRELMLDEQILEKCVRSYAHALALSLRELDCDSARNEARAKVKEYADTLEKTTGALLTGITLHYPWRSQSPALMALLKATLGERLGEAASTPFSDRLTLMQGAEYAEEGLREKCTLLFPGGQYTALPPISRELAAFEAMSDTEYGYVPDSLRMQMDASGSVEVSFTIAGEKGSIQVARNYPSMEQVELLPEQIPVVAVWPAIPLPEGMWQAYYVSCRGRMAAEVFSGTWLCAQGEEGADGALGKCRVVRTPVFPGTVLLSRNDLTLGALFFRPKTYVPTPSGEALAGLDLGESGSSVAWRDREQVHAVSMPAIWRALLRGSRWDLAGEALPVLPLSSVVPSAVVFEEADAYNEGRSRVEPFLAGHICPQELTDYLRPCCHFLWRSDEMGERARKLQMRQLMEMTSFDLVMHGVDAVTWHLAVPYGMEREEKQYLHREAEDAAREVAARTGLPCKGVYSQWHGLRAAGSYVYQSMNRASFLMMDLGGGDTGIALWLRGMSVPVLEIGAGDGLSMAMHKTLMDIPLTAAQDLSQFAWLNTPAFTQALMQARESVTSWEGSLREMDGLLGEHLEETLSTLYAALSGGYLNYTQSLLLLELSRRLVLCGLALEAAGNVSTLTDKLPESLPLVLTGRGANVYLALPENLLGALLRFVYLPLRQTHPVKHVHLTQSPEEKMEAAYGLVMQETRDEMRARIPLLRDTVPVDWLVGNFLMLFTSLFPQAAAILFPGACRGDGMLSEGCAALVMQLGESWKGEEMPRAFQGCLERLRVWPNTGFVQETVPSGEMPPVESVPIAAPMTGPQGPYFAQNVPPTGYGPVQGNV